MTILALEPETSGADAAPVTLTRETNSPTCEALDIERAPTHLVVVNANAAFARIENHRKLFRYDVVHYCVISRASPRPTSMALL